MCFFCVPLFVFLFSYKAKGFFLGKSTDFLDSKGPTCKKKYLAGILRIHAGTDFTMSSIEQVPIQMRVGQWLIHNALKKT